MASWMPDTEKKRELLSQAILRTLKSWPEAHRRAFSEIHYCGRSVEDVATALAMSTTEVCSVLKECERKLLNALQLFRPVESRYAIDRCAQKSGLRQGLTLRLGEHPGNVAPDANIDELRKSRE